MATYYDSYTAYSIDNPGIVPNSASTFDAEACVVGSENKTVWLGGRATAAASLCWYCTGSAVSGCELLPLNLSVQNITALYGPFNSPNGVFAACLTTSICAICWMRQ